MIHKAINVYVCWRLCGRYGIQDLAQILITFDRSLRSAQPLPKAECHPYPLQPVHCYVLQDFHDTKVDFPLEYLVLSSIWFACVRLILVHPRQIFKKGCGMAKGGSLPWMDTLLWSSLPSLHNHTVSSIEVTQSWHGLHQIFQKRMQKLRVGFARISPVDNVRLIGQECVGQSYLAGWACLIWKNSHNPSPALTLAWMDILHMHWIILPPCCDNITISVHKILPLILVMARGPSFDIVHGLIAHPLFFHSFHQKKYSCSRLAESTWVFDMVSQNLLD
jgi:hypothetical protein